MQKFGGQRRPARGNARVQYQHTVKIRTQGRQIRSPGAGFWKRLKNRQKSKVDRIWVKIHWKSIKNNAKWSPGRGEAVFDYERVWFHRFLVVFWFVELRTFERFEKSEMILYIFLYFHYLFGIAPPDTHLVADVWLPMLPGMLKAKAQGPGPWPTGNI